MLIIGIVLLGTLGGLVIGVATGWDWEDRILGGISCAFLYGFVALVLASLLQMGAESIFKKEYVKYSEDEIVALNNTHEYEGSFFLGSGTIDGKQKYYYMIEEEKGINIKSVNAEKSYVKEDNNKNPKIEYMSSEFTNNVARKLFINGLSSEYIIHIPENSIKYDFNIEL